MSLPIGRNESENAAASGMTNANIFVTFILPPSLSVIDGRPPSAKPTKMQTVGIGYAPSAHSSGKSRATMPHTIPIRIGNRVRMLFLKSLKISAIAPTSFS